MVDQVHHLQLFNVLSDVKSFFRIKVILNWCSKIFASVRWNNVSSNTLPLKIGALEGSFQSPNLFNLFVDVIVDVLPKAGCGCFVRQIYIGCLVVAGDIIFVSASIVALHEILDICFHKGEEHRIVFKNSKFLLFKLSHSYDCCI